jgi:hypothetical protein
MSVKPTNIRCVISQVREGLSAFSLSDKHITVEST